MHYARRRHHRGLGRRWYDRENVLERLESYQRDLEQELADVSDLITRLIEQRVTMQRQLAELSATLLPSHPAFGSLRPSLPTCANRSAPKSRRLHRAWRMRHR